MISIVYYSLIEGFGKAVIFGRYTESEGQLSILN